MLYMVRDQGATPADDVWLGPWPEAKALQVARERSAGTWRPHEVFKLVQTHHIAAPIVGAVTEVK